MEIHEIVTALFQLLEKTLNELAAIQAIQESRTNSKITSSRFLQLANDSIVDNILISFAALFDKAKFSNSDNCSFLRLKMLLESNDDDKKKYDSIISSINNISGESNSILPREFRNKTLAHNDWIEIFNHQNYLKYRSTDNLDKIKDILIRCRKILSDILKIRFDIEAKEFDFIKEVNMYRKELLCN